MQKKTSTWVTIREESPVSVEVSANENIAEVKTEVKKDASDFVQNKLFWGVSFVVLLIFTAALIAPGQFLALLKGNLFDTGEVVQDSTVVQASTGAVSVQVDPINVQVDPVSSNQKMLEELKLQLEEFKKSGQESDASIALLTQLVESQMHAAAGNAADADTNPAPIDLSVEETSTTPVVTDPVVTAPVSTTPIATAPVTTQDAASTAATSNVNLGQNINLGLGTPLKEESVKYRLNPYKVQMDPYQILQQNMATYGTQGQYAPQNPYQQGAYQQGTYYAQLQQGMQANVSNAQVYNAQAYNAQLAKVQGTPQSGPHEALMIAFGLTFLALIFRKGFRLFLKRTSD